MGRINYPDVIKHYPKPFQLFIKMIHNRIELGRNCLIVVVGATGSGKSFASLRILMALFEYQFGRTPTVEEIIHHTIFKAKDLMEKINDPNLKKKEKWLWDEAGVDVGHKTHASIQNRVIGYLCQTFRNLQQVVIFTVPTTSFIDASVRKMLHYQLETVRIVKKDKVCVIKTKHIQYNNALDKIYYHPLYFNQKGGVMRIRVIGVKKPPQEYCDAYEKVKSMFTTDLNLQIQQKLQMIDEKDRKIKLTERQEKIIELLDSGVTSTNEIAKRLDTKAPTISLNFGLLRRKGIDIDKYLGKSKN